MAAVSSLVLSLFYCYAHEDASLRAALDKHLAMLKRLGLIESWSDLDISAGTERQEAMHHYLRTADILLLLVSADFLSSDYCYSVAMQQALQRHQAGEAVVIPIIVRPVEWEQTPLRALLTLPRDGRPVTQWGRRDQAWKQIASEIRIIVEALRRPVVVDSSPQLHPIAAHLISFLEAHGVPTRSVEHTAEHTKLHETIRESSAVVLIASSEMGNARTLKKTQNLAAIYQCPILGIWVAGSGQGEKHEVVPPKEWSRYISIDQEPERQEEAFQELLHHLKQLRHRPLFSVVSSSPHALVSLSEPRNPYKGLRAFTSNDTRDFFGRTALIDKLAYSVETMITLAKKTGQHARLLAVVGPSGSGKSSVIMAGLLPCLRTGEIFDSEAWVYLDPLVAGEHPLEALALTLFEHFPEKSLQMLRDDLQDDSARGLHFYATALARRIKSSNAYVVLVVDQFEELFTLSTNEQERQQFIDLLVTACTQRGGPLIVILTLRADFYDRPMQYPSLYTLIEQHQVAMLPMTQGDLRAVITQPAMLPDVQLTFEGSLVGDLLFDVQGQIGALPLLQFTLDRLFQQRAGHQLTLQAYHDMGGVKGALSHHAEQTYQDLPSPEHHTNARALFLRLIDPGFTEQDATRRRAPLSEFKFTNVSQTQCMQETIEAFVQARLLTTKQSGDRTTIEVSHEAVIREWKRLADWLRKARDDVHIQQRISRDAATWERSKRSGDRLYQGTALKEAQFWEKRNIVSRQEQAFLRASAVKQLRSLLTVIAVILLIVTSSGIAGWVVLSQPHPDSVTRASNDGTGSLRWAIANAPSGSIIKFASSLIGQTIVLKNTDLHITRPNVVIQGPAAGRITVRGIGVSVIVDKPASATISDITFQGSRAKDQQALIQNAGRLTLKTCLISGNVASPSGGGGGISNNGGTLTVSNTTISGNAVSSDGGGISNNGGTLTVSNTTISGNSASVSGGGISNNGGILTVSNTTIAGNSANEGGGIYNFGGILTVSNTTIAGNSASAIDGGYGGGIASYGLDSSSAARVTLMFCTIVNNRQRTSVGHAGGFDLVSFLFSDTYMKACIVGENNTQDTPIIGEITSGGYNLIQRMPSVSFVKNTVHSTDRSVDDLTQMFGSSPVLGRNGGPTETSQLIEGRDNPAIGLIPQSMCTDVAGHRVLTDQRGMPRPGKNKSSCDVGAYEYQAPS